MRTNRQVLALSDLCHQLLIVSLGNKLPGMTSNQDKTNRDAELIESLKKMAEKQTMRQQETALEMERDRCLSLPLAQLGSERVTSGKFNGKEVREAFEDKKYMVWMATHQPDNMKFVNLLMYAQRQAELETAGKSSSAMPAMCGNQNVGEWIEVMGQPTTPEEAVQYKVKMDIAIETTQFLREQVNQLQETSVQHHQMLYQAMLQLNQQKETIDELNHRIRLLEQEPTRESR